MKTMPSICGWGRSINHTIATLGILAGILIIPIGSHAQTICGQQPPISVNNNTYIIQNNEFGSPAQECINVNGTIFTVTQSAISNATNGSPGAYPSIYKGCHWGNCTSTTSSNLPVQVSVLSDARSDWNTTQPTAGTYDAAYDIWFNTTSSTNGQPNGAELMIWLNYRGTIQPAGSKIASGITIGGRAYDVWEGTGNNAGITWNIISYVANNTTLNVSNVDIKAFTTDAVSRGYINSSWYLIAIEAGFELWQGGAGLSTNSFSTTVNNSLGTAPLNIIAPTDNSVLTGTVSFKAVLANTALSAYQMYWSVDGGQFNLMSDNTTAADKEALVDLTGWTWRDAGNYYGPFQVNFTVEDLAGNIVQQKTIVIYRGK